MLVGVPPLPGKPTASASVPPEKRVWGLKLQVKIHFFYFFLKGGNISMVVIYYARDIIEYDGRRPELSNAALHMK